VKLGVNIKNGNNPERVEFDNANWRQFNPLSGVAKPFFTVPRVSLGAIQIQPFQGYKFPTLLT
jgi:hypothetical protein